MIEVKNLTKNYGSTRALKEISFEVHQGEVLGFLGPNGAGKTTAMRILTCFLPATSGEVIVGGFDVYKDSIEVRKLIGYLPETVPLYTELTVNEYLKFVAQAKGLSSKESQDSIKRVIDECGLEGKNRKLIKTLSKGYRQRVGLAQALVGNPPILILDEPTVGLDPRQIIEIRDLIRELGRERTVILSTHILPEVSVTCQRVLIINNGMILAEDTQEDLTKKLKKASTVKVTVVGEKENILKTLKEAPEITEVKVGREIDKETFQIIVESPKDKDLRASIAKMIVDSGFGLLDMKSEEMTLEEIFIKVISSEQEVH